MAGLRHKIRKYILVQYTEDDIYQVVPARNIINKKIYTKAKYYDGRYYEAKIITRYPLRRVLAEIAKNMSTNMPQVILNRQQVELYMEEAQCKRELTQCNISFENDSDKQYSESKPCATDDIYEERAAAVGDYIKMSGDQMILPNIHKNPYCNVPKENDVFLNSDDLKEACKHGIIILDNTLIQSPLTLQTAPVVFDDQLTQTVVEKKSKAPQKKHCCYYCHKHVFKIYRHYINVHKHEKDVKELSVLPSKTAHRKLLLDNLRKKGDYIFNTQIRDENENKFVCRQTLKEHKTVREKDVPCPNCKGYYSKFSIRHHIQRCMPVLKKTKCTRLNIQAECRKLTNNIHQIASDDLRNKVFPILNEDDITNVIRYDEAVIHYGNYLCRKYTTPHHYAQVRSNMRALGRLIIAIKETSPDINNLYEALDVCHIDLIVKGIDQVAGLDKNTKLYKAPATAMLLSTELKRLCKLLHMEFLKKGDKDGQKRMENLATIFNLEFHVTVNKKGVETQKINNRRKKTILPKTDQIARFRSYLEKKIESHINKLNKEYSKEEWLHLTECTLVHLAVFNRKRPGETQRILIDDYKNYEIIDDDEIIHDFDALSKEQIKKWARIRFTGKLGKNTALLVHRDLGFKAINLILKYREISGVARINRYVFGAPSQFRTQSTFQACHLIRKYADMSGIENSELLRTRLLRQHFATETATSTVDNHLEGRVSDFMSHKRQIHEDYYVMTQKNDDITKVSRLLENFSTSKPHHQIKTTTLQQSSSKHSTYVSDRSSSKSYSSDEDECVLSQSEVDYIMGKKRNRHLWTTEEKNTAREHFHEEIYFGTTLTKQKVDEFFESNKNLYKLRTPHLIMQWVKGERNKVVKEEEGIEAKRLRWSTPEKEILRSSTERHSAEGSNASISECELLLEENKDVLNNRTAQSIKSYIYAEVKRLSL